MGCATPWIRACTDSDLEQPQDQIDDKGQAREPHPQPQTRPRAPRDGGPVIRRLGAGLAVVAETQPDDALRAEGFAASGTVGECRAIGVMRAGNPIQRAIPEGTG